jgi:hypothetical protein
MALNVFIFEDVEIKHTIPDYLVAGASYDIDITIQKGEITGFAKFQMEVPDGINVKSVEVNNSSFTFNEGVVKNIWMTIPNTEEVILSYKFDIAPNYQGTGTVKAQFVYIKENERYSVGMKDHNVTVGDDGGNVIAIKQEDAAFVPEKVKAYRSVKEVGQGEFEISIKVEKDGLEGFAKIQDELPSGFTVELLNDGGSVFSLVGNKVKFIWFNVPGGEEIEVSYLLKTNNPIAEGTMLGGTFNFIYKDDARFIDLPSEELIAKDIPLLVEKEPEPEVIIPIEVINEEPIELAEIEEKVVVEEEKSELVVDVSDPQSNVFYRVQLAASKKNVKVTYFKNKFKYRSEIFLENHKGWYKYTTGNYDKYRQARDRREDIKDTYQFRGPFVTAYNAGERITVQEALLISKQKWVK